MKLKQKAAKVRSLQFGIWIWGPEWFAERRRQKAVEKSVAIFGGVYLAKGNVKFTFNNLNNQKENGGRECLPMFRHTII